MNDQPPLPATLRSTAMLFLAIGGVGLLHSYTMVVNGAYLPSPALLGFPICFGLLRVSNIARYLAIVVLGFIACLYLPTLTWVMYQNGTRPLIVGLLVVIWMIHVYQLRVLFRPDVRKLFHPNG